MAAVMAGGIPIFIFVFCRLLMDDFYADSCFDNQEDMWDDGFDDDQDSFPDCPGPPQEPRKQFGTKWQVVLSLRTLPNPDQRTQTFTKAWPKIVIEGSNFNQIYTPEPCPFCRLYTCDSREASDHRKADLRIFIADNIRKAAIYSRWRAVLALLVPTLGADSSKPAGRKPRGRGKTKAEAGPGITAEQIIKDKANQDKPKKARRKQNKAPTKGKDTDAKTQTTTQSDPRDTAVCQGLFQKQTPLMPVAERSAPGFTLDTAPDDHAISSTSTADQRPTPSLTVRLASLHLSDPCV